MDSIEHDDLALRGDMRHIVCQRERGRAEYFESIFDQSFALFGDICVDDFGVIVQLADMILANNGRN